MKTRHNAAITLIEVLLVLVVLFILLGLFLPATTRCRARSGRISCASSLKQVGLAFRMWANEHGERFPMELTTAEGGTKESALQGLPLTSFLAISNEINNPKPFTCPDDTQRTRATMFSQLTANLSYFLSVDAAETNPASILSGDRNLLINGNPASGLVQITDPATVTWGPKIHKHQGNIGLADGSAHQVTDQLLQKQLRTTGLATNRFAIP